MRHSKFSWAMFVGVALGLGQVACAEDDPKPESGPSPEQLFKDLDKNSDGQLSVDEVGEERRRFFERLVRVGDKNDDGKLSSEEFQNASKSDDRPVEPGRGEGGGPGGLGSPANAEEMFKRLDTNGDGKLTKSEIPERARGFLGPIFERLGKDELTKEDIIRVSRRLAGGEGFGSLEVREAMFKRLDSNGDGKLTLSEVPERGRPMVENMLSELKRDKDGSISKEEFLASTGRFQENRRRPAAERAAEGERKPEGERRPDGERRPEGERRPLPRFFEKIDANRDGRISAEELAKASELFKELDENGDGQLDPRELLGPPMGRGEGGPFGRPMEGDRPGRRPEGERQIEGGRPGERGQPGDRPAAGDAQKDYEAFVAQLFAKYDKNGDGKISLEEAPDRLRERFSMLDRNGDGQMDKSEVPMLAPGASPAGGRRGRGADEGNREKGDRGRPELEKSTEDPPREKPEQE